MALASDEKLNEIKLLLPAGGSASAANQVTTNAYLTSIDGKIPTAAALADGAPAATSMASLGARLLGYNGTSFDRLRAGITAVTSTLAGLLNTLPWGVYNATPTTRTEGQGGPLQTTAIGDLRVSDVSAVAPLNGLARIPVVDAAGMTRPNDGTAYAANDAVANSTTAGSVTPISFTVSDTNDAPVAIRSATLIVNDTAPGAAAASFRLHLFRANPTAVAGDNAAFAYPAIATGYMGSLSGSCVACSDGSVAILTPDQGGGQDLLGRPTSGGQTVFGLLQTLTAYTPGAAKVYTTTIKGFQGRA